MTLEQECEANETDDAIMEYLETALADAADRAHDSTQPTTREHYLKRANAIRRATGALRVKGMLVGALEHLEWAGASCVVEPHYNRCPDCGRHKNEDSGHASDCALSLALTEARKP